MMGEPGINPEKTTERRKRMMMLLDRALASQDAERAELLADVERDDPAMRRELESLIAADQEAGGFLETPALESDVVAEDCKETAREIERRIGPYLVEREIGRGGMGAVYLAARADDQFDKLVAIKVISGGTGNEGLRQRFLQERQILAGLEHSNIARLYDGGTTEDGAPYLVMEYVEGLPIDEYCGRRGLGVRKRLDLFLKVCDAAQYAHQNLVVHRDIKPRNILVTEDGAPKLLDFGIAKPLQPGASESTVGLRPMTPAYASPEQIRGEQITTASDVYSLGVVLYELLAGERPYDPDNGSPAEMVEAICEQEPERPSAKLERSGKARLDRDLDDIVLMALRKEPSRRYASVREMAEDIRRYLDGLPVLARHATFGYRAEKFVRRNKVGVGAAMLIVLTLLGAIMATAREARIAREALHHAEAERTRAEKEKNRAEAERVVAEQAKAHAEAQRIRAESEKARAEAASAKARIESQRAEREKARAERRFNDVRLLAGSFMTEIHKSIQNLPGSTRAQSLLVGKALEHLDSLARCDGAIARLSGQ